jgi:dolichyl-phosphate beta-glucosyltransferase
MSKNIKLSLVIPAFNEEKIIKATLDKVLNFLSKRRSGWEVVVVDDGSSDTTSKIVKNFSNLDVRLIRLAKNQGKGAAIRMGIKKSRGNYIIFSDADLSVPLKNIDKFLSRLEKSDVVIGSRRVKGAKILVHQHCLRETLGRGYTQLTKFVTGVNLSDFTCGFKGFTRRAAVDIFGRALIDRWAYDSEILFLAKKLGYKIAELPVSWKNREETRVVLGIDVLTSFSDLLKIRVNDILGRYDK